MMVIRIMVFVTTVTFFFALRKDVIVLNGMIIMKDNKKERNVMRR